MLVRFHSRARRYRATRCKALSDTCSLKNFNLRASRRHLSTITTVRSALQRDTLFLLPWYRLAGCTNGERLFAKLSTDGASSLSFLRSLHLHPEQIVDPGANKWIQLSVACATHVCMGSVFALSVFNSALTRVQGVVAPAAVDWALGDVTMIFTLVMSGFGWGAIFARYHDRLGLRACGLLSASCILAGFSTSAIAVQVHSLVLLYGGGLVWGMGIGWGYVPAVANALRWFPERKGFAGGATVAGFGAGSILAAPLFKNLLACHQTLPQFLGPIGTNAIADGGRLFINGVEVVACVGKDASTLGITEGFYAVATGSCGVAETFLTCGLSYASVVALCALIARTPSLTMQTTAVDADLAKGQWSPQFALMGAGFGFASIGSYAVISTGSTMLIDVFGARMPEVVTPSMVAAFVSTLGLGNLAGRLFWPNFSDYLAHKAGEARAFEGRRRMFMIMWTLSPVAYIGILMSPFCPGTNAPLLLFVGSAVVASSCLGGAAASRPAFVSDTWGAKVVSTLVARQMTVLMAAAYVGPRMMAQCRENAVIRATSQLAEHVDDIVFEQVFHGSKIDLPLLLQQKTVTLQKMVELCGPDVLDPTPFLYNEGLTVCVLCQMGALATNWFLVAPKEIQPIALQTTIKEDMVRELGLDEGPWMSQRWQQHFMDFDSDCSGYITYEEFLAGLQKSDSTFTRRIFDMFDADGNGTLSLSEFIVGLNFITSHRQEDHLKFAFMLYDSKKNGVLDLDEVGEVIRASFALAGDIQKTELELRAKSLFARAGLDETESITLEQFLQVANWNPSLLAPAKEFRTVIAGQLEFFPVLPSLTTASWEPATGVKT